MVRWAGKSLGVLVAVFGLLAVGCGAGNFDEADSLAEASTDSIRFAGMDTSVPQVDSVGELDVVTSEDLGEPEDVVADLTPTDVSSDLAVNPCLPNPCVQAPANQCGPDGVQLLTFSSPGLCSVVGEEASCQYPSVPIDCSVDGKECKGGKCVSLTGDPCTPNPCTEASPAECDEDGATLLTYALPGQCSDVGGEASCAYSVVETSCEDAGKVCDSGACVTPVNPCSPNPCDEAPANHCVGQTLLTYSIPGECKAVSGEFSCSYPPQSVECVADGLTCEAGACVPVNNPDETPSLPGEVIFTEIMPKSQAGTDYGEWFELFNTTSGSLSLSGCTIRDDGTDSHVISGTLVIPPGEYLLLARSEDSLANHGLSPDYIYGDIALSNSDDELILECDGVVIDEVTYDSVWVAEGQAIQLDPEYYSAAGNDTLDHWCFAVTSFGTDSLKGTPGAGNTDCSGQVDPCQPNPCIDAPASHCHSDGVTLLVPQAPGVCTIDGTGFQCSYPEDEVNCSTQGKVCTSGECVEEAVVGVPTSGQLVFSEFMARSISGGGDLGEWVELTNVSTGTLDLQDCQLQDSVAGHTIATSVVVLPGQQVVLAASDDTLVNHGLEPDYVYQGIVLNNADETLSLVCGGALVDTVTYTSTWVVLGTSTQLSSDLLDATANDESANWCPSTASYGDGMLGTPGAGNALCE